MNNTIRIIAVDRGPALVQQIRQAMKPKKVDASFEREIGRAFERFEEETPDVLILSGDAFKAGPADGMELLQIIREKCAATRLLVLAGKRSIALASDMVKRLGCRYGRLPASDEELAMLVEAALAEQPGYAPNLLLKQKTDTRIFENMVGGSPPMQEIYRLIRQAAVTDVPVLIYGETGTGKDLVAKAVHQLSTRSDKPFLPIHLGALPRELVSGELFGYEKGAFTGALKSYKGSFEKAKGGTIFLDEIGTVDEKIQISLLRLLETRKFMRLGGNRSVTANVRIIAATNENLDEAVADGRFREDLYFRLEVFQIILPPVRERNADITLLVNHFLNRYNEAYQRDIRGISPEAVSLLQAYDWPGNVREIKNALHSAVLRCTGRVLEPGHLPGRLLDKPVGRPVVRFPVGASLKEVEREMIVQTLRFHGNNRQKSARVLGISRRALYDKMKRYRIQ